MARIRCKCGNVLNNVACPNDIVMHCYPDKQWDDFINMDPCDPDQLPESEYQIWVCPECKRMFLFKQGSNRATRYVIEPFTEEELKGAHNDDST